MFNNPIGTTTSSINTRSAGVTTQSQFKTAIKHILADSSDLKQDEWDKLTDLCIKNINDPNAPELFSATNLTTASKQFILNLNTALDWIGEEKPAAHKQLTLNFKRFSERVNLLLQSAEIKEEHLYDSITAALFIAQNPAQVSQITVNQSFDFKMFKELLVRLRPNFDDLTRKAFILIGEKVPFNLTSSSFKLSSGNSVSAEHKIITFSNGDSYAGMVINNTPHGQGIYISKDFKYYGLFKNGLKSGYGITLHSDGSRYAGYYENDSYNGQGIITYPNGTEYKGNFLNGLCHGSGTLRDPDGSKYEGEFVNSLFHGRGILNTTKIKSYEGEFANGLFNGQGSLEFLNGKKYSGNFENGYQSGYGVLTYPTGHVYHGEFKKNRANGYGVLEYANGDIYKGEFKNGIPHGKGTLSSINQSHDYSGAFENGTLVYGSHVLDNGYIYSGEFKNMHFNGKGKLSYPNGNHYQGDFKNNKLDGYGILNFNDGSCYIGEFKDGMTNGTGVHVLENGNKYEGTFINNKKNGFGCWKFKSGTRIEGVFRNNRPVKGVVLLANGDVISAEKFKGKRIISGIHLYKNGAKRYIGFKSSTNAHKEN